MGALERGIVETRWSLVLRAAGAPTDDARKALGELCRIYRSPLAALARRLAPDAARADDLVQGFLARLVAGDTLSKADETRGRFRDFLRRAFHNYAIDVHRRARTHDPLVAGVEVETLESGAMPQDELFDQLWAQTLIDRALARLRDEHARRGKGALFDALRERLEQGDDDETIPEAVARLGMSTGALTMALRRLRPLFAARLREEVAETLERPEDVDLELQALRAAWGMKP